MDKKEVIQSCLISVLVAGVFFYKFFFFGLLPFPGDLLIAEYKPWRSYSLLGYNPGSYPNKAQYPDTIRQLYPWKTEVIEQLKSGSLPLWNPHNFSGSPLLANFQSAALYPLEILYFLFSQPLAWGILVFLQPVLASFFTYWYCRSIKLSPLAATLAAVSFAYGSFMTVWLEYNTIGHVIIWLPLALLAIEALKRSIRLVWIGVLIWSLTMPILAGHPQIAAYLLAFSLIYVWFRIPKQHRVRIVLGALVFPVGIASVQIIPGVELFLNSARSIHPYNLLVDKILIQPWQLLMLIFPDIFGNPATRSYWPADTYVGKVLSIGIVPLFFLLAAKRSNHPVVRIFFFTSLAVLICTTKNPLTLLIYRFPIPVLSTSNPTLMGFLFQFSMSVLCAMGLDQFVKEQHTLKKLLKRSAQILIGFCLCFLTLWLIGKNGVSSPSLPVAYKALIYALLFSLLTIALFCIAISQKRFMIIAITVLLCVHISYLFWAFHKFNPFVPRELVYPTTDVVSYLKQHAGVNRIWGYGTAAIEANFATQLGLYSPDGYDPLYPKWYGEFIGLSKNGAFDEGFTTSTRSDAIIAPGYGGRGLIDNSYRLAILGRLGVKYILDRAENGTAIGRDTFINIYDNNDWHLYELTTAVPRVTLVSQYSLAQTRDEFQKTYFRDTFDPKQEVILGDHPIIKPLVDGQEGLVRIDSYTPQAISITTSTRSPKLLVLSDTYYPGWKASIDTRRTPVLRANYTMRAIAVPTGNHTVTFTYEPVSVYIGLVISSASLAVLILWMYSRHKANEKL